MARNEIAINKKFKYTFKTETGPETRKLQSHVRKKNDHGTWNLKDMTKIKIIWG